MEHNDIQNIKNWKEMKIAPPGNDLDRNDAIFPAPSRPQQPNRRKRDPNVQSGIRRNRRKRRCKAPRKIGSGKMSHRRETLAAVRGS
jgi:hypothetical protein